MEEARLLGNEELRQRLRAASDENKLTHSYIIAGPVGSGKHTLSTLIAAAMQCTAPEKRPCLCCAQCRKVLSGSHPDVITVDSTDKKTIPVELIRQMRSDLYILPNEGKRKIYIFPRAMDMNANGENALLKAIEEPPDYGAFLFLTENAAQLLPTIRSRSVVLQMTPLDRQLCLRELQQRYPDSTPAQREAAFARADGYLGQAMTILEGADEWLPQSVAFAAAYAGKDRLAMTQLLVPMERLKRDNLLIILKQWQQLLAAALSVRGGRTAASEEAAAIGRNRTAQDIFQAVKNIQRASELAQANVNVGTICGALQVQLR